MMIIIVPSEWSCVVYGKQVFFKPRDWWSGDQNTHQLPCGIDDWFDILYLQNTEDVCACVHTVGEKETKQTIAKQKKSLICVITSGHMHAPNIRKRIPMMVAPKGINAK